MTRAPLPKTTYRTRRTRMTRRLTIQTVDSDPACSGRRPTPNLSLSTRCREAKRKTRDRTKTKAPRLDFFNLGRSGTDLSPIAADDRGRKTRKTKTDRDLVWAWSENQERGRVRRLPDNWRVHPNVRDGESLCDEGVLTRWRLKVELPH